MGSIKERIVDACIELMRESGDASRLTVRSIAARAKISVGLVNYHFQSKDNLVDQSVRMFIDRVIRRWNDVVPRAGEGDPVHHLEAMLTATAGFLAEYPVISRISILHDFRSPSPEDNSGRTLAALVPVLREISGPAAPEQSLRLEGYGLMFRIQAAFLRSEVVRSETGFDFFDETQRRALVRDLVDAAVRRLTKAG